MGLDSVELLFKIEKKFQIQIRDEEASQIFTLANFTDTVSKIKRINTIGSASIDGIHQKIVLILMKVLHLQEINLNDKISLFLNAATQREWTQLKEESEYEIPVPSYNSNSSKILTQLFFRQPNYDWNLLTVKDFIEGIFILNSRHFVNFSQPQSKQEIYYGIAGIISKTMDIDVFEINPEKRITTDLGIN